MESGLVQALLLAIYVSVTSSQPTNICIGDSSSISVMPGQSFDLNVTISYRDQQPVPVIVISNVSTSTHGDAQVISEKSGPWLIKDNFPHKVSIAVQGSQCQNVSIALRVLTAKNKTVEAEAGIELSSCVSGFVFSKEVERCMCKRELTSPNIGINCDVDNGSLQVPAHHWFGFVFDGDNVTLGYMSCLEYYCKSGPVDVSSDDFTYLCIDESHRSGVGCGSCSQGYSAIFGSSQCQECTNTSLLLILLFLATGILTIVGIAVLRITLTEGYLNAVLFYSNIANVYADYFTSSATGKGAFFLTAWISQSFGIPACFYNGMTTLAVAGLHLLYVTYLFALTVSFKIILGYKTAASSEEYAPSKLLGTLLVVCYTSLLETCVGILSFSIVTTLEGDTLTRWHYDANVVYFSGLHGFLSAVAVILFVLFLLPFPFLLVSPRITYKIRFLAKLQPLLDTFWAPLKPKYRWWLSFRLFLRWIIVFVATFVPSPYNVLSISILLALLLFIQSQVKPFHGYWQNVLDEALVLNLILLLSGHLYFFSEQIQRDVEGGAEIYGGLLVAIAYLFFIVVFLHHLFLRFPKCKLFLSGIPARFKTLYRDRYYPMEELNIQETDEVPPEATTHFEISISKEEKEEDKQNLTRELHELESLSGVADTKHHKSRARPRVQLKENRDSLEGFPLLLKNDFTKDREPLLAEDDCTV